MSNEPAALITQPNFCFFLTFFECFNTPLKGHRIRAAQVWLDVVPSGQDTFAVELRARQLPERVEVVVPVWESVAVGEAVADRVEVAVRLGVAVRVSVALRVRVAVSLAGRRGHRPILLGPQNRVTEIGEDHRRKCWDQLDRLREGLLSAKRTTGWHPVKGVTKEFALGNEKSKI